MANETTPRMPQAVLDSGLAGEFPGLCRRALGYLEQTQARMTLAPSLPPSLSLSLSLSLSFFFPSLSPFFTAALPAGLWLPRADPSARSAASGGRKQAAPAPAPLRSRPAAGRHSLLRRILRRIVPLSLFVGEPSCGGGTPGTWATLRAGRGNAPGRGDASPRPAAAGKRRASPAS